MVCILIDIRLLRSMRNLSPIRIVLFVMGEPQNRQYVRHSPSGEVVSKHPPVAT